MEGGKKTEEAQEEYSKKENKEEKNGMKNEKSYRYHKMNYRYRSMSCFCPQCLSKPNRLHTFYGLYRITM